MEAHTISHQLTKFGGHRHCGSGDMMVLICKMMKKGFPNSVNRKEEIGNAAGGIFLSSGSILTIWTYFEAENNIL